MNVSDMSEDESAIDKSDRDDGLDVRIGNRSGTAAGDFVEGTCWRTAAVARVIAPIVRVRLGDVTDTELLDMILRGDVVVFTIDASEHGVAVELEAIDVVGRSFMVVLRAGRSGSDFSSFISVFVVDVETFEVAPFSPQIGSKCFSFQGSSLDFSFSASVFNFI